MDALTRELHRFDKIAEAFRYYCRMAFPDMIEQDDKLFLIFENGHRFTFKEKGESEDVAVLRISKFLDMVEGAMST